MKISPTDLVYKQFDNFFEKHKNEVLYIRANSWNEPELITPDFSLSVKSPEYIVFYGGDDWFYEVEDVEYFEETDDTFYVYCSEEEPIVTISTNKTMKVNYDEKIINRLAKIQNEIIEIMKLVNLNAVYHL